MLPTKPAQIWRPKRVNRWSPCCCMRPQIPVEENDDDCMLKNPARNNRKGCSPWKVNIKPPKKIGKGTSFQTLELCWRQCFMYCRFPKVGFVKLGIPTALLYSKRPWNQQKNVCYTQVVQLKIGLPLENSYGTQTNHTVEKDWKGISSETKLYVWVPC